MRSEPRITSVQVIFGRPRHKLFFGWGQGLSTGASDAYIAWLWEKWRNMPPRVDPAKLDTTPLSSDKTRSISVKDAPRPRKPGRRQATGGQTF